MLEAMLEDPTPVYGHVYHDYTPVPQAEENKFRDAFYYYGILFNEYWMTSCVSLPVVITFIMWQAGDVNIIGDLLIFRIPLLLIFR